MNLDDAATRARIIELISENRYRIPTEELQALERELQQYEEECQYEKARVDFLTFCHLVYPNFKEGAQHRILAPLLEAVAFGRLRYLAVSIAPRHGKTEYLSYLFSAWYIGLHPEEKLMMATHTASLSESVGRRVRNLIDEDIYHRIFPEAKLSADSKSAGSWSTTLGGSAYYAGVGSSIAGRGSNLLLIDDPHNEQDALSGNPRVFQKVFDWYALAFQRRQQGAAIIILHTRWAKNDLIGCVLDQAVKNPLAPQYQYIELPMELPSGKALWSEVYKEEDISEIKNAIPLHRWMSQYQQQPTSASTSLVPAKKWVLWTRKQMPECEYVFISLDAAIEQTARSDYSVFGVFGVFRRPMLSATTGEPLKVTDEEYDDSQVMYNIILMDAVRKRLEYPELKQTAVQLAELWTPDLFLVEKKANGAPLIQDMRRMQIPVKPFEPVKDKYARLQQVTDLFDQGVVWVPEGYRWAEEFMQEVENFPADVNDDCVDCLSQALAHFKQGAFAPRKLRWQREEDNDYMPHQQGAFYRIRNVR